MTPQFNGLDPLRAVADSHLRDSRLRLEVHKHAERALRDGHPWVFEQSIIKQNREGQPGQLAVIFDSKNRFLAVGLYDPDSVIRVKVLQAGTPTPINADFYRAKMQAAFALRAGLEATQTNGYRMIHGENDGLPGLILDRYAQTLVLKLYSAAWLPHLPDVLTALYSLHPAERLVLRLSRQLAEEEAHTYGLTDGHILYKSHLSDDGHRIDGIAHTTDAVIFQENGLTFSADVIHGHKTGFFFDQRDNRAAVRDLSQGADVLDVFAYSGGFSVAAAAGGAKSVLSVDISEPALQAARHNFALNNQNPQVSACAHSIQAGDAFDIMRQLASDGRRFDVVIVDAPSFAKRAQEVDRALAAYGRLARLAGQLVNGGGVLVLASCSSRVTPEAFFRVVTQAIGRPVTELQRTFHAIDHPIGFAEGAYLKCFYGKISK